ncbi:putative F420-dependent oxidoreductase [Solirubrobacter pauli]|uniref:Putative F420-dependent oxidoreductase n=1 Tax=Solirubrobacter pauli TaxID=166793 RepID=A0A660LDH0_9ACTN|nr:LLM class F420-dependent oxidoreductase [Solirubrobacter pauli]RKQ93108.1 putative F420-dependent oxidoreductase [Solirubrobacter pauli]
MSQFRVGVQVQPQHASFDAMRRAWQEADALGVDSIFTWDHFFPLYGDADGAHFEGITTLTALAASTEHAQVGALVICNSYRNPELLADAHRTIDHVSGGRAILGIGAGWFQRDYDEYGYEFGEAKDRLRDLRQAMPRIKDRIGKLNPQPLGTLPILIGGSGPKVTLKLVAQYADMWHSFGDAEDYKRKNGILLEHCEAEGRDPGEIERTWGVNDLEHADALAAEGVQHFIIGIGGDGEGYDLSPLRELVKWRDAHNG